MYFCYVDESGSLDCGTTEPRTDCIRKNPIFVLSGLCVYAENWRKFSGIIDQRKDDLRDKLFRTKGLSLKLTDCELKSSWIRIPTLRQQRPFLAGLSEIELSGLVNLCYQQIERARMTIVAIVVDKRQLSAYFDSDKLHRKAWELLLERVEHFMRERHDRHSVIFIRDDISVQVNRSLAEKHAYLLKTQATSGLKLSHVIEMPLFTRSELSNGIQLADLVAYNFYHAFDRKKADYPYLRKILSFVYNSANTPPDKLDGLKLFPPDGDLTGIAAEIERASVQPPTP
jgi:hypothetical protein